MARWLLRGMMAVLFVLAVGGYGLAVASRDGCIRDTTADIVARDVRGFLFDGTMIRADAIAVTSEVRWPFVVDVYYSVPVDLHATLHRQRYIVLPWGSHRHSHTTRFPV